MQRFVVHPPEHQDFACVELLSDRGEKALRIALQAGGDRGVKVCRR
jgi:hypothetical protein